MLLGNLTRPNNLQSGHRVLCNAIAGLVVFIKLLVGKLGSIIVEVSVSSLHAGKYSERESEQIDFHKDSASLLILLSSLLPA